MANLERYTPKHMQVKEKKVQKALTKTAVITGTTGVLLFNQNASAFAATPTPITSNEGGVLPESFLEYPSIIQDTLFQPTEVEIETLTNKEEMKKEEGKTEKDATSVESTISENDSKVVEEIASNLTEVINSNKEQFEGAKIDIEVGDKKEENFSISINIEFEQTVTPSESEANGEPQDIPTEDKASEPQAEVKEEVTYETKEEGSTIVFDPSTEYGQDYKVKGTDFSIPATLTEETYAALENQLIRPVDAKTIQAESSAFGARTLRGNKEFHRGMDFAAEIGTPIYAAMDGKVVHADAASGYGNWIVLEHEANGVKFYTLYGHMEANNLFPKEGDIVKQGDIISLVGNEGRSTGPHLHFAVSLAHEGRIFYDFVDPSILIDEEKSNQLLYTAYEKPETSIDTTVIEENPYLLQAVEAAKLLGWDPLLVYSQWRHETANFTSNVFVTNNNLAGQTWFPGSQYPKGSARPANEGGYYIKYPSAVEGYIDFIQKSPRYAEVKNKATAEEQAEEIARAGWAVDPTYAEKLKKLIADNRAKFGDILTIN